MESPWGSRRVQPGMSEPRAVSDDTSSPRGPLRPQMGGDPSQAPWWLPCAERGRSRQTHWIPSFGKGLRRDRGCQAARGTHGRRGRRGRAVRTRARGGGWLLCGHARGVRAQGCGRPAHAASQRDPDVPAAGNGLVVSGASRETRVWAFPFYFLFLFWGWTRG